MFSFRNLPFNRLTGANNLEDNDSVMKLWLGAGNFGRLNEKEATRLVEKAIDFGFEGVDTAPLYADSEEKIGIAFKNLQTRLPVSSKMSRKVQNSVEARHSIEKSLENLKIDQLHYLFVHSVPVQSYENYLSAIVTEKNNNLIGKIGYSGDDMNLKNAIELGQFECVMGTLNILDQNNLDMLREAREKGIQTFVKRPLANAFFSFSSWQYFKVYWKVPKGKKPNWSQIEYQRRFKTLKIEQKVSVLEFINFQKYLNIAEKVVVGASSVEHLQRIHEAFSRSMSNSAIYESFVQKWKEKREEWDSLT